MALTRFRWAIWGIALLVGIGLGTGLLLVRSSDPKAPTAIVSGPASTWSAGAHRAPAFDLVDQNGRRVSPAAFRGRPLVVTFLDPRCTDFCPVEAARLQDVVRSLPPAARPAIVGVSVNIFANAHADLMHAIRKWGLGSEFHWGVGTPAALSAVWHRYAIGVLDDKKTVNGRVEHNIVHTEAAYVIDASGYERAVYLWPFTAADMKATIAGLRR